MKTIFVYISVFLLITLEWVEGHGRLSQPRSRGVIAKTKTEAQELAPVSDVAGTDFICRNDPASTPADYVALTAGGTLDVKWIFSAAHVGDCFVYFTYDADKPDAQKLWFKVAQWDQCEKRLTATNTFTIPAYLPSSPHIIVRWEWYALHVRELGKIEWYSQCFDASITGSPTGSLPDPKVNIPGHLPSNAKIYRDGYGGPFWYTGPQVATIGGTGYTTNQYTYGTGSPGPIVDTPPPAATIPPVGSGATAGTPGGNTGTQETGQAETGEGEQVETRTPCELNTDCPSKVCMIDKFCSPKKGFEAGSIAALVFAFLIIVVIGVAVAFFVLNKKEIPYMVPFKGRI